MVRETSQTATTTALTTAPAVQIERLCRAYAAAPHASWKIATSAKNTNAVVEAAACDRAAPMCTAPAPTEAKAAIEATNHILRSPFIFDPSLLSNRDEAAERR